jgi:hypothetical protein
VCHVKHEEGERFVSRKVYVHEGKKKVRILIINATSTRGSSMVQSSHRHCPREKNRDIAQVK